jgi:hemerythrin-like domain-containing protein
MVYSFYFTYLGVSNMDAIQYLRAEHSKVRKMLAAISKAANEKTKIKMFNTMSKDLLRHEQLEEKIWYPVLRKDKEMRDLIKHLVAEEKAAAKTITKLKTSKFGIIWRLKFYKFKHDVDHHAKDEEKELFPMARKYLSKTELNALGAQMRKFKSKV